MGYSKLQIIRKSSFKATPWKNGGGIVNFGEGGKRAETACERGKSASTSDIGLALDAGLFPDKAG